MSALQGCVTKILRWIENNGTTIIICFVSIVAVQVSWFVICILGRIASTAVLDAGSYVSCVCVCDSDCVGRTRLTNTYSCTVFEFESHLFWPTPPASDAPINWGWSRSNLWPQKTRVLSLSCGVVCVILRLAVLLYNTGVWQTHTHIHTHARRQHSLYRASIASRGKNGTVARWSRVSQIKFLDI